MSPFFQLVFEYWVNKENINTANSYNESPSVLSASLNNQSYQLGVDFILFPIYLLCSGLTWSLFHHLILMMRFSAHS